jgi:CheY-like chemotaxis protein
MAAIFERRPQLDLVIAASGAEALRMAAERRPALLLLDLGLPDCHGAQLLGRLRTLPGLETPAAIAVTADVSFDITGTGFAELWAKPLNLSHVLGRLDTLVGLPPLPAALDPHSEFAPL